MNLLGLIITFLHISGVANANETMVYKLDSCVRGMADKSPIEYYIGSELSIALENEKLELIPLNGFKMELNNNATGENNDIPSLHITYHSTEVEENKFQIVLKERGNALNKDFERKIDKNHKIEISLSGNQVLVDWAQEDEEWENVFSCVYKTALVAKN